MDLTLVLAAVVAVCLSVAAWIDLLSADIPRPHKIAWALFCVIPVLGPCAYILANGPSGLPLWLQDKAGLGWFRDGEPRTPPLNNRATRAVLMPRFRRRIVSHEKPRRAQ